MHYAVKISPKIGALSNNEVNILKNLEHPNLVHLIEVIDDPQVHPDTHLPLAKVK